MLARPHASAAGVAPSGKSEHAGEDLEGMHVRIVIGGGDVRRDLIEVSDALCQTRLSAGRGDASEAAKKGASGKGSRPRSTPESSARGPGAVDGLDFEATEQAARQPALRFVARAVEGRLNADRTDCAGPTVACACGQRFWPRFQILLDSQSGAQFRGVACRSWNALDAASAGCWRPTARRTVARRP